MTSCVHADTVDLLEGRVRLSRLMGAEDVVINDTDHRGVYSGAVPAYVEPEELYVDSMTAVTPCRFFCLPGPVFAVDTALHGAGTIVIRTRRDGDHALVEVADDGRGIPPEVLPRVFEAFFTTKPAGQGSGLGLDNARRIAERGHHGTIGIDTSPGGTTVRVRLPPQQPA